MKVCQLFLGQAQLKAASVDSLQRAVPDISDDDIAAMQDCPFRGFDSEILKEPNVYRTYEAITHYGEAIKMLINEVTTARLFSFSFRLPSWCVSETNSTLLSYSRNAATGS